MLPSSFSDQDIEAVATFRCRGRIPACSWSKTPFLAKKSHPVPRYLSFDSALPVSNCMKSLFHSSRKHPFGHQTMWRCSQPKVGMKSERCLADERLFETIRALNPWMRNNNQYLTIFDCRPKINAMGNKLAGKGFEDTHYYRTCTFFASNNSCNFPMSGSAITPIPHD